MNLKYIFRENETNSVNYHRKIDRGRRELSSDKSQLGKLLSVSLSSIAYQCIDLTYVYLL